MIVSAEMIDNVSTHIRNFAVSYREAGSTGSFTNLISGETSNTVTLDGAQEFRIIYRLPTESSSVTVNINTTINGSPIKGATIGSEYSDSYTDWTLSPIMFTDTSDYEISCSFSSTSSAFGQTATYTADIAITSTPQDVEGPFGKILIGGVEYGLSSGIGSVGGTSYSIQQGKTMSGGTAYNIKGTVAPISPPTLQELFEDMVVSKIIGINSSSSQPLSCDDLPQNGTFYTICVSNAAMSVWKLVNGKPYLLSPSKTILSGVSYNGNLVNPTLSIRQQLLINSSSEFRACAATMAFVQFPHYNDAEVDACLSDKTICILAHRDGPSYTGVNIETTAKTGDVIIVAHNNTLDVRNGSSWAKISGTSTDAAAISGNTLVCNSNTAGHTVYGATIAAIGTTSSLTGRTAVALSTTGGSLLYSTGSVQIGDTIYNGNVNTTVYTYDVIGLTVTYSRSSDTGGDITVENGYNTRTYYSTDYVSNGSYTFTLAIPSDVTSISIHRSESNVMAWMRVTMT